MEDLDRKIVEQLSSDGRMSYTDLGRALGMSTSAVHQRVRRLAVEATYRLPDSDRFDERNTRDAHLVDRPGAGRRGPHGHP